MIRKRIYQRLMNPGAHEGTVRLRFRVDQTGYASDIELLRAGLPALEDAVLDAFRHAIPFPPPPASILGILGLPPLPQGNSGSIRATPMPSPVPVPRAPALRAVLMTFDARGIGCTGGAAHRLMGDLYLSQSDLPAAIGAYEQAVDAFLQVRSARSRDDQAPQALRWLAVALQAAGKREAAEAAYRSALVRWQHSQHGLVSRLQAMEELAALLDSSGRLAQAAALRARAARLRATLPPSPEPPIVSVPAPALPAPDPQPPLP